MKQYLKNYGIKTIAAHPIQYGSEEYAVPKPQNKTLAVLVDFAHGKTVMHIHTDHHEGQIGVEKGTSTSFVKTPSNAAYISQILSPSDLFPPKDAEIISTVDSANFVSKGITPDDIMRTVFNVDKSKSAEVNREMMGYATNKLILAYKNKPKFLTMLVMNSNPSLISLYNNTKKLAEKFGYKSPIHLEGETENYLKSQMFKDRKINKPTPNDIKSLKNGESLMVGATIMQHGGGKMWKGNLYDRYIPFKVHPNAHYFCILWPMGLIQLSKNPFKGKNPYNLGDIVMNKVMPKFKSKLQSIEVSLNFIKQTFEKDKSLNILSMGFTFKDFVSMFEKEIKGLSGDEDWRELVKSITDRHYKVLSDKQKRVLRMIKVSLWDIIMAQSGGHHDITNISGINFAGNNCISIMKDIQVEIAKEMVHKRLEGEDFEPNVYKAMKEVKKDYKKAPNTANYAVNTIIDHTKRIDNFEELKAFYWNIYDWMKRWNIKFPTITLVEIERAFGEAEKRLN